MIAAIRYVLAVRLLLLAARLYPAELGENVTEAHQVGGKWIEWRMWKPC